MGPELATAEDSRAAAEGWLREVVSAALAGSPADHWPPAGSMGLSGQDSAAVNSLVAALAALGDRSKASVVAYGLTAVAGMDWPFAQSLARVIDLLLTRTPAPVSDDPGSFEEPVSNLEELVERGQELALGPLVEWATGLLLEMLVGAARAASIRDNWPLAAQLRGQYLRWWHSLQETVAVRTRFGPDRPGWGTCFAIGGTVAGMHSLGVLHGALLLENFASDGAVINLGSAQQVDGPDADALANDLEPLRHQLANQEWLAFCAGYLDRWAPPEAVAAIRSFAEWSSDVDSSPGSLPFRALHEPHPVIRLIGYALRHLPEARVEFTHPSGDVSDAVEQIMSYAILFSVTHGVDDTVADEAARTLVDCVGEMHRRGYGSAAAWTAEVTLRWCRDMLPETHAALLEAYREMNQTGDPDARQRAGRRLLASDDRGLRFYGEDLLDEALDHATTPEMVVAILADLLPELANRALDNSNASERATAYADILDELDVPKPPILAAYLACVRALSTADDVGLLRLLDEAEAHGSRIDDLASRRRLDALLVRLRPMSEPGTESATLIGDVSETARAAYFGSDLLAAVDILTTELETALHRAPTSSVTRSTAALLAGVALQLSDAHPEHQVAATRLIADVVHQCGPRILDAADDPAAASVLTARAANSVGWALVKQYPYLDEPDPAALDHAIGLLEAAVRLQSRDLDPGGWAASTGNLALALRQQSRAAPQEEQVRLLERASTLLEQVVAVDETLVTSADPRDRRYGGTLYLDRLNLGLVCHDLAEAAYDGKWISRKSLDSAHWLRRSIIEFERSRQLATDQRVYAVAGTASTMLGRAFLLLCEHYVAERSFAGGDLTGAMYEWYCAVAGGEVSTARLIDASARSTLAYARAAAGAGAEHSPGLMMESAQLLIELLNLGERRGGLADDIRQHALVTALDTLDAMAAAGFAERYPDAQGELPDLRDLLHAMLRVEVFAMVSGDPATLADAAERFRALATSTDLVIRAVARIRADWFGVDIDDAGVGVNGLYATPADDGVELRIPAQRRRLRLGGFDSGGLGTSVRSLNELRERSRNSVARLEPRLDWQDVPDQIAVGTISGDAGAAAVTIETSALPIPVWNTWLLWVANPSAEEATLTVSLPFLGRLDTTTGVLDPALPAVCHDASEPLVFGEQGLTLEVSVSADGLGRRSVRVSSSAKPGQGAVLQFTATEVAMVLRATPRVATADVLYLVKDDHDMAGACCAAAPVQTSPAYTLSGSRIASFAPLYLFDRTVPDAAFDLAAELSPHEIVIVGVPDDPEELDGVLNALFDPRRDLLMLVTAAEVPAASAAVERLRYEVRDRMTARLLGAASSSTAYFDPVDNIQIGVVERADVPAAAQILLDLASVRRSNPEDIPLVIDGVPTFLNVKGNPAHARRVTTLFDEPVDFTELLDRYHQLVVTGREQPLLASPTAPEQALQLFVPGVAARPALVLPDNPAVVATAVPYARHLGAVILIDGPGTARTLTTLEPTTVYTVGNVAACQEWDGPTDELPGAPHDLARHFADRVRAEAEAFTRQLLAEYPGLGASEALFAEMRPGDYAVLAVDDRAERAWTFLAANYAAALGAPLVLVDPLEDGPAAHHLQDWSAGTAVLAGTRHPDRRGQHRDLLDEDASAPYLPSGFRPDIGQLLNTVGPTYVGFVSSQPAFPIELCGDPPLALRFAVGRLAGPDLATTATLIARAALGENVVRPPDLNAIVVNAAEAMRHRDLPGARDEAQRLHHLLGQEPALRSDLLGSDMDLDTFLDRIGGAHLIHFAGHGTYDEHDPAASGLIFDHGTLTGQMLVGNLEGAPIVFGNACQSGILTQVTSEGVAAGWSGLAAAFIASGAVNYLGSLWPVFDEASRHVAVEFYRRLCRGIPVGEALRLARSDAYSDHDPTWAAYVLFGCPRNRLRPEGPPS